MPTRSLVLTPRHLNLTTPRTQKSIRSRSKSKSKKSKKTIKNGKIILEGKKYAVYRPHHDPAFFSIFVEREHADHLAKKDLDDESRLQVIYHVLKDQLRLAKKDLLKMKNERDQELKRALDFKRKLKEAAQKADKNSIAQSLEPEINDLGIEQLKYTGQDNLHPALKNII